MASEKTENPTTPQPRKKKGKSEKQSGNWFQRKKVLITWVLAIAFASTCIGFTGIAYVTQANKDKETKQQHETQVDKAAESIKFWEGKLLAAPSDPMNEGNLGYAYQESALDILSRGREKGLSPDDKARYDEHLKRAEEHFVKAINLSPDKAYSFAAVNLADVYILENKNDEAIKVLEDMLKKSGNDEKSAGETLSVREKLCYAYQKTGKNSEAIKEGELVLKGDPGNYSARMCMAKAYRDMKDNDQALKLSEEAIMVASMRLKAASDMGMRAHLLEVLMDGGLLQGDLYADKKEYVKAREAYDTARMCAMSTNRADTVKEIEARVGKIQKYLPREAPKPQGASSATPAATPQAGETPGTITQTVPIGTISIPPNASPGAPVTITPMASPGQ